jgi:UrcA family protein
MLYAKILMMCAAGAITTGELLLMAPHASARQPIIVTAPLPEDLIVRHVSYADLNLASEVGVKRLNRRVGSAVKSLCNDATGGPNIRSLGTNIEMIQCSVSAWNGARPQIDRAVRRAQEIAATGSSAIAAAAITISMPE